MANRRQSRRSFLIRSLAAGSFVQASSCKTPHGPRSDAPRPNILWITCEDMNPNLGFLGDEYARTPNLDKLAQESVYFERAFATAPVCSPARSCLITGVYATSLGTQNLRSKFPIPSFMEGFPSYLRKEGYFCTNNVKTDYNTANEPAIIKASWDQCSASAHWRNRKPGQPFFAVFNDMTTHQSRTMVWPYERFKKEVQAELSAEERHDPAEAPVPPYYPDTPIVRRTIARYYDCITVMDKHVGKLLSQLKEDGLFEDTIIFFFSDHGAGLPRHKRALYDTGLHVPLLVRFPEKWRHLAPAGPGERVGRLVSFVDFPPTVLKLAGIKVPSYMQGIPFTKGGGPARRYVYGARDRVDEAYDLARSVRDERYLYIRTYMPHLSYNQPSRWPGQGEIRKEIEKLALEGKLTSEPQRRYALAPRPLEELYDTATDPLCLRNLVESEDHRNVLSRLRKALDNWIFETRDLGFLPEEEVARRSRTTVPYFMRTDSKRYPLRRIKAAAELVGRGPGRLPALIDLLKDEDPAVRFWAALGCSALGAQAQPAAEGLSLGLSDPIPCVRAVCAEALLRIKSDPEALKVLTELLSSGDWRVALRAARALELLGERARPAVRVMKEVLSRAARQKGDPAMFIRFALQDALERLQAL